MWHGYSYSSQSVVSAGICDLICDGVDTAIASASKSARDKMAWLAATNLLEGLEGKRLPNCVNPLVYK
jgi:hypothetical protein